MLICFLLFSLLGAGLYLLTAASATAGTALLIAVLIFLGLHLLFALVFALHSLTLRRLKPDEGLKKINPLSRWLCIGVARWLCDWGGARPRLLGAEKLPEEPFLFVCNHRSMYDPLTAMLLLRRAPFGFISKPSNLTIPCVGIEARYMGCIAIDRENNREALKTILLAADYLKRGLCSVGIYPEGTRSRSGELLPFHAGSFKIAQRAGAPVVVACVRGTERVARRGFLRPTRVELEILDVIDAERVKALGTNELAEEARARIAQALGFCEKGGEELE